MLGKQPETSWKIKKAPGVSRQSNVVVVGGVPFEHGVVDIRHSKQAAVCVWGQE